jgi:hypothetical protein
MAILAALLLSIPTRASRRAARAQSRIVGRVPEEPLVLPRHAEDVEIIEDQPVGAIEDPQDSPTLNDEALAPIAEPSPPDDDSLGSSDERSSSDADERPTKPATEEDR